MQSNVVKLPGYKPAKMCQSETFRMCWIHPGCTFVPSITRKEEKARAAHSAHSTCGWI